LRLALGVGSNTLCSVQPTSETTLRLALGVGSNTLIANISHDRE